VPGIEVRAESSLVATTWKNGDISLGVCYVEMMIPLKVATKLISRSGWTAAKITTAGMVTSSHPGFAWDQIIGMAKPDRERWKISGIANEAVASEDQVGSRNNEATKITYSSNGRSPSLLP